MGEMTRRVKPLARREGSNGCRMCACSAGESTCPTKCCAIGRIRRGDNGGVRTTLDSSKGSIDSSWKTCAGELRAADLRDGSALSLNEFGHNHRTESGIQRYGRDVIRGC